MVWKEVEINRLEMVPVPLNAMLEMVAFKRGLREEYADLWCNVMSASFADLGIHSLREFSTSVLTLNDRLVAHGWKELRPEVLQMMIAEVSDMMFGPKQGFIADLVAPPRQSLRHD